MRFLKLHGSAVAVAAALLLASCGQEAPPAPPPPEVTTITVGAEPISNVVELPGRVQAFRTAEVRARVDGIIQRRLYEEGTDVGAGRALFQIDPRQMRANANAASAQLSRAQASAANAGQVVRRYSGLVGEQAISRQEYDAAIASQRTAQADVANARAQVDSARLMLGYSTVTAPISGRVGRAQVTEGALASAAQGTLLTTIEQIDRVYINFSQSSSDLLALRQSIASGALNLPSLNRVPVRLVLEDGSIYPFSGQIDFLDLAIDEATGTAALRAEFVNPGRLLLPGQFVRARILAGTRPNGIAIPQRAVKLTSDGATVMVVGAKNLVEVRKVKLGEMQGDRWAILEGLKVGDRVIVNGQQKAMPGQPVTIAKPRPAGVPASAARPATRPAA
ncbi:efflux RND transporter periplasmic adaptor subunit [Sphingomonas sp. LY29]|uniref:efflux RND transporter periplasmic adaptor subunit n=1 Tax=Sphingomonas sp. LY29 TaxID=3095341 RepID=UPI002D77C5B7|nr:efflux RND transporter periplasmic adaptor subunit [Sphingomonas sp. LY29]WRP25503.1 efflux RND transporter periplasmic adaptor subunit [Sphingomonas sp. LY29]